MRIRRQIVVFDAADLAAENGTPQQQIHLDLWVDDLKAAHEKAVSLGARLLQPADDPEAAEVFQVYADPAGHPFCLCWASADS
jgi:predicted enzyme related to lactoylglutathione lyase